MSYLKEALQPDERLVCATRLHWIIYLPGLLGLAFAAAIFAAGAATAPQGYRTMFAIGSGILALLSLGLLVPAWVRRMATEIAVTDRRILYKRGIIARHTEEMNLAQVESVDVDQTVFGRMLGYGTVTIHGTGSDVEPLPEIADPLRFRAAITAR